MTLTFNVGEYVAIRLKDNREFHGVVWYGTNHQYIYLNSGANPPHKFAIDTILSVTRPVKEHADA